MKGADLIPPGLGGLPPSQAWALIAERLARQLTLLYWYTLTSIVLALVALAVAVTR